jgi:hypothetical protein
MSVHDTLNSIKTDIRLPTREEAAAAAEILLLCNGMDLSDWSDDLLPCDEMDNGLKAVVINSRDGEC